ncbi:MAG: ribonuclease R [Clostridia bacterium]|nr:ribonuclease R [Clostridia bacterium]
MKKSSKKRSSNKSQPSRKNARSTRKSEGKMVIGTYRGTGKGFAFLTPDDGGEDYFIPPSGMGGALNGDRVTAHVTIDPVTGKSEARVCDVLQQITQYVVGTYEETTNGRPAIIPDDGKVCQLFIVEGRQSVKPKIGYKVVGLPYERDGDILYGDLIEVLGEPNKKSVDILSIARAYGLSEEFPPEVEAVVRNASFEVSEDEMQEREDFRNDLVITIDGLDAKDLDDAVSVERTANGYRLCVHIADVSHYVKENGAIDKEAFKRGTSVYFPGSVFPMLPRELSNGICSLNEGVNRLTLSCVMEMNKSGALLSSRLTKGLIKSARRMDYDTVASIVEGDSTARAENADVCEMLDVAKELALLLNSRRLNRGSIEFELPEAKIILDDNGKCVDVQLYEHKISHMIIEEFMLSANEAVASTFNKMKSPFVYRVHEAPPPEKELAFIDYLETLGIDFSGGNSSDYAQLFNSIKGNPNERAVSRIGLRSMSKAKYMTKDAGHFGLSAKHYCHFTSPIRRYPDLQIHRIISDYLAKGGEYIKRYAKIVSESATQSSIREQVALTAERRVDDVKKAEYMKSKIGESFDGVISSVTEWGVFVELPNCIEGLVRKEKLGESVEYNEKSHALICEDKVWRIGDEMTVTCDSVENGKINFIPTN